MSPASILDLIAVFIFALTGGLVASRAQLDVVGFLFLGCLTGVGGGTLRDLVLGRDPVFWVGSPHYLGVACAAAILAFFTAHRLESRYQAIVWLDALALSVAAAAGVSIAREAGASWPIVLIMGVATGTFGGLMRDVVTNEIPLVLRQGELYVSACLAGALLSVLLLRLFPEGETLSLLTAAVATFVLRAGSLRFGWRLPVYRPRAPRTLPPRSAAASPGPIADGEAGAARPGLSVSLGSRRPSWSRPQPDREPGARAARVQHELALEPFDDLPADREAEAGAAGPAGAAAGELREDPLALGLGDAGAVVLDSDLVDAAVDPARHHHLGLRAGVVLDGVRDQVDEHLREPVAVALDAGDAGARAALQRDAGALGQGLAALQRMVERGFRVEERDFPGRAAASRAGSGRACCRAAGSGAGFRPG